MKFKLEIDVNDSMSEYGDISGALIRVAGDLDMPQEPIKPTPPLWRQSVRDAKGGIVGYWRVTR